MSITDRLFRRSRGPELALADLQTSFAAAVVRLAAWPLDRYLLRARFADGFRSAGVVPASPEEFDHLAQGFDDEGWRRFALAVTALDAEPVRRAVAAVTPEARTAAFVGLAIQSPLLTLELLGQSPLRLEEFTRQFIARLGAGVQGESASESTKRLARLDYATVLGEAERARKAAEDRVERLRALQDERERARPRRGKF